MSIELITGRAGKPHVDSQDVRAYQAYTAGSGRYVLHGATCSVESANEVPIAPGEILVDGSHVRVMGDGESVTLVNGQTGYKRADIVALHYTVTGSGDSIVESMEFAVVQGSPSDTDPVDPDMPQSGSILDGVTETYIPYARVIIDGLSPQEPEMIVEQYALPSAMGGIPSGGDLGSFLSKVSATDYDAEWKTVDETLAGLGVGELLWEGSFKGGSITVPSISDYTAVVLITDGEMYKDTAVIMVRSKDMITVKGEQVYVFSGGYNTTAAATIQGNGTVAYQFYTVGDTLKTQTGYRPGTVEFTKDGAIRWNQDFKEIFGLIKAVGDYR